MLSDMDHKIFVKLHPLSVEDNYDSYQSLNIVTRRLFNYYYHRHHPGGSLYLMLCNPDKYYLSRVTKTSINYEITQVLDEVEKFLPKYCYGTQYIVNEWLNEFDAYEIPPDPKYTIK